MITTIFGNIFLLNYKTQKHIILYHIVEKKNVFWLI